MKRLAITLALSMIGAAALISNAGAAPTGAMASGKTVTLHLVAKEVGSNFVDNPPRQGFDSPPLIGDQFTFTSNLTTRSGAHAGRFAATCTVGSGGPNGLLLCYGYYSLKGGQIMGIAKGSQTNTTQVAVVGGTGAYAGVTGTSTEISHPNSPVTDITIHLTYP